MVALSLHQKSFKIMRLVMIEACYFDSAIPWNHWTCGEEHAFGEAGFRQDEEG